MKYKDVLTFARNMRKKPTPAEKLFWANVRGRKLMGLKFNRQFIVEHGPIGKRSFFIPDFYCHEKRLIVELDGAIHKQQVDYDRIRENILKELGYNIIRFENKEVLFHWRETAMKLKNYINQLK